MAIEHSPELEPREPRGDDLEVFDNLEPGDVVNFFEWPVEPLTVIGREEDEKVGERVRVEAEGEESFLYVVDANIWHYVDGVKNSSENNPFPVQGLSRVDVAET